METIKSGTIGFHVTLAADCVVKLAPSTETAEVLVARLDRTLHETRALKPNDIPSGQAEMTAALASALSVLGDPGGYQKIERYFAHADWSTSRDREFFDGIAARGYHRPELTETFYLALTRIPASGGFHLARACSLFHRPNLWVIRDKPKFIHGVLSALFRLERGTSAPYHEYARTRCEGTLLTQLLDEEMRQAFLKSFLNQLSEGERHILDRFLAKIIPPPDTEVAERLVTAFFAVPWGAEHSTWQNLNPDATCESFHGESYVTLADDLRCMQCSSKKGSLHQEYYFYPDVDGKACTLQKVWFSYPTTSRDAVSAVTERLARRMGPGTLRSQVHGPGSADWRDISFWDWQGREVYIFRNLSNPTAGEGLPLVEILARDQELVATIAREEAAERAIEKEGELQEGVKKERLYRDVAKSLPDLIQRLEKASDPETRYSSLLELLLKIAKKGPHRAAQLYLADWLAREVGEAASFGRVKDWDRKEPVLSAYGIVYSRARDDMYEYDHVFLRKILEEGIHGFWAKEAFLRSLLMGICEEYSCEKPERFKRVIAKGEDFLKRNPRSHIRKQVLLALEEGQTGVGTSRLHALLNEVLAIPCPEFSRPGNESFNREAYVLRFCNTRFL